MRELKLLLVTLPVAALLFASRLQIEDLKVVLPQVGFDYRIGDGDNWQNTCPQCRRRQVALAQTARVGGFG